MFQAAKLGGRAAALGGRVLRMGGAANSDSESEDREADEIIQWLGGERWREGVVSLLSLVVM